MFLEKLRGTVDDERDVGNDLKGGRHCENEWTRRGVEEAKVGLRGSAGGLSRSTPDVRLSTRTQLSWNPQSVDVMKLLMVF